MANHTMDNEVNNEYQNNTSIPKTFTLVTWTIDVTGWRLIDEIFRIAAYMPNKHFSEFILPQCNFNSSIVKRYNLKVVTRMNGVRMLKNLDENEMIKTVSENCGLIDFITWLEENRGNADGIILLNYEMNEKMPVMLLEALERNYLLDRFMAVVNGFVNVFNIAKHVCPDYINHSFHTMTKTLLNKEPEWTQELELCYELLQKLSQINGQRCEGSGDNDPHLLELVKLVLTSIDDQKQELINLKILLQKREAWKPIFADALKSSWRTRTLASRLRNELVEKNVDLDILQSEYKKDGKESILKMLINCKINKIDSQNVAELVGCYFNSEDRVVLPKFWPVRGTRQRSTSRRSRSASSKSTLTN